MPDQAPGPPSEAGSILLPRKEEITGLLKAAEADDRQAVDRLFSILYGQLRSIAHRQLPQAPARIEPSAGGSGQRGR
jgi:hypothetical protein